MRTRDSLGLPTREVTDNIVGNGASVWNVSDTGKCPTREIVPKLGHVRAC